MSSQWPPAESGDSAEPPRSPWDPPAGGYGPPPAGPAYGQPSAAAYYGSAYGAPTGPAPPTHLVWAILSTIFCCLPFGIVSIVYAAQVSGKYSGGDYQGALDASRRARTWAIVATAVGAVLAVLWVGLLVAGVVATGTGSSVRTRTY